MTAITSFRLPPMRDREPTAPTLPAPGLGAETSDAGDAAPRASQAESVRSSGVQAAEEALFDQEVARSRLCFGRLSVLSAVCAVAFVAAKSPTFKPVCIGLLLGLSALTAWSARRLRDKNWYTSARITAVGALAILCGLAVVYYTGVLSLALVALMFGPLTVGVGPNSRSALLLYLGCALGYAGLVVAVTTGLLPEIGAIAVVRSDAPVRLSGPIIFEMILFGLYVNTRRERATALSTITRQLEAARSIAQREALLQEAREELERALRCDGLGRFSDSTVGSFRLGKVIGRGAMGEVYEAAHAGTGARAAVKLLHLDGLGRPDLVKRFLREASIAASLDAPNVVRVVEIGDLSSPFPYIAMERLEGEDLADHLRCRGPMSLDAVIRLVREVGSGLEAARDAGIVHRDLKPRNVFLVKHGAAKILDFGVSRLIDAERAETLDGLVGTPGYMAPEQARGEVVSPCADLFSLGVIAYRALTGRPAFSGEHVAEILFKLTTSMPPRPSEIVRAHPQIDLVFAIAMAKEPGDRFDSGRQFADAIEAARAGRLGRPLVARAQRLLSCLPWPRSELGELVTSVA
jgi:hypothetical protein